MFYTLNIPDKKRYVKFLDGTTAEIFDTLAPQDANKLNPGELVEVFLGTHGVDSEHCIGIVVENLGPILAVSDAPPTIRIKVKKARAVDIIE